MASTDEGSYYGSLLHVMVHMREQTKEPWCGIADIHQMRVRELNMATSLWSRSKQKKLILLMMMMLENDASLSKKVARKTWARLWLLRRQEEGAFYTLFLEMSVEDFEYMKTPYAEFELINFYTFSRRHVEF